MRILTLDVETTVQRENGITDNSPFNKKNRLVSIHYLWEGLYFDRVFYHKEKPNADDPTHFKNCLEQADVIVAHNAKFDIQWLIESNFIIKPTHKIYCTMIGEYIFARGQRQELSLEKTAERRNVHRKKSGLIEELFKGGTGFEEIPLEVVLEYARADVQSCAEIYAAQQEELKDNKGLIPTFTLMNEMLMFLVEIEKNGIMIDSDELERVEHQYLEERATLEALLKGIVGEIMGDRPINLHSGQDMTKVIYSKEIPNRDLHRRVFNIGLDKRGKPLRPPKMSIQEFGDNVKMTSKTIYRQIATHCTVCNSIGKIQKYKKDGTPWKNLTKCTNCEGQGALYKDTNEVAGLKLHPLDPSYASINGFKTDKATIQLLISQANHRKNEKAIKFLEGISRLNSVNTYLNSFVNGIKTYKREDNLLHAHFNQCVTATGRLSSSHPNFQNQPKSHKFPVRKCIVSRFPGGQILEADYSGLEFRVCGMISNDKQILQDVKNGKDIHTQTAMIINQIDADKVTKELRFQAKAHSFAPLFGSQASGQEDHVRKYYTEFFTIYSGVKKWHDSLVTSVLEEGIIRTPSGREFKWDNPRRLGNGRVSQHTQVVNYPVQSFSCADLVVLACIRAYKLFRKLKMQSKLILTVHDSIVVDCHPNEIEDVKKVISFAMMGLNDDTKKRWNYELSIPLDIEMSLGKNWMELNEINLA